MILVVVGASWVLAQKIPIHANNRFPLKSAEHGIDGWIQVVTDARLTEDLQKKMWGIGDWTFVLTEDDPRARAFSAKPPANAKLQILDSSGQVTKSFVLERPLARIEKARLRPDHETFLVTVDYSIGMGSYAGPSTSLLEVENGNFAWLKATDSANHKDEPIQLAHTLKSDWKLVPFQHNRDILEILCRPDAPMSGDFVIHYVRYRFTNGKWIRFERTKKGIWESDESFPPSSSFPQS